MPTKHVSQQRGVADGTAIPAAKADGRQVNAMKKSIIASKPTDEAWNIGDTIFLGKKAAGSKITCIRLATGTSLGTSTIDIGIGGDPRGGAGVTAAQTYVAAATLTTVDRPTTIGPRASTLDDAPDTDEVYLWATIGVANIAAAVALTFELEMVAIN